VDVRNRRVVITGALSTIEAAGHIVNIPRTISNVLKPGS